MDGFQVVYTILFAVLMTMMDLCTADHEYMVTRAEHINVPLNFETKCKCQMNIPPDKFQWKFYPYNISNAYNPKAIISLSSAVYEFVKSPSPNYEIASQKWVSDLTIRVNSEKVAGEYQCLAYYGAFVVASVPWKITLAKVGSFPEQNSIDVTVVADNTVNWRCEPPLEANPQPYVDYYKDGNFHKKPATSMATQFLVIPNTTSADSGQYQCKVVNTLTTTTIYGPVLNLKVVQSDLPQAPRFIMTPKRAYEVVRGGTVFLECAAVGNPVPKVVWERADQGILPGGRSDLVPGGFVIRNVTRSDGGLYRCTYKNAKGSVSHEVVVTYLEPPRIDCLSNSTDVKQAEVVDLDCHVGGVPRPEVTWFLNGFAVNDTAITTTHNEIHFRPVEKRHAGNLQIFARNVVDTANSSISIRVIPLTQTQDGTVDMPVPPTRGHRKGGGGRKSQKHAKMIPPSKPIISRLNDEAVMVRWSVPSNKGLPIQFFKVQYRELGPATHNDHHGRGKASKWMTSNTDIPPHVNSYEVNGLKPDYLYRFRIAAVYSNNDNKNSMISDKFHLKRLDFDKKNPLPIPIITNTETVNTTAVKIYWKYDPTPNITVEGFVVNYNSASSAADYMKEPVDDAQATSYILAHLQPDTVYDIKLQTFTSRSASEFSSIMKAKTLGVVTTTPENRETSAPSSVTESTGISKLYIVIAGGVLGGFAVIFGAIVLLLFCRKWKQEKDGDRNKPGVDDRHIQVDGNEYVVGPKGAQRANGCVPSNRITITANPLADADNKNQNMIEMSCLSSQNNNCSTVQPSASGGEDSPTNSRDSSSTSKKHSKNRDKRIVRNKIDANNTTAAAGENYV